MTGGPAIGGLVFQGRTALVTGASRGIGRAIALALAAQGADIAVGFRARRPEAEAVAAEVVAIGRRAVVLPADLGLPGEAARLVAAAAGALGPVTVLVANAGIGRPQAIEAISEKDWNDTLAVNLTSAFFLAQAALPAMRAAGWGRILAISSTAAQTGGVIGPHYTASKAGLIGLVHSLAGLTVKDGVTVNALAPAFIETGMTAGNASFDPARLPVGRLGTADEVAATAVAILANGYMTGQTVNVNGGLYMS